MKKAISLLLIVVLCLSLCACGKSEAVKNVEAMIDALMGATEYNVEEIEAIHTAFATLSEKEQKKVGNYDDFCALSDDFYASALVGTWYPLEYVHNAPEELFSPHYYIVLNADHTYESVAGKEGTTAGTWEIRNKCLTLFGLEELSTLGSSWNVGSNISINIAYEDGFIYLDPFIRYYKEHDYFSILDDILLTVDCANVDLNDYIGFTTYELIAVDEWGARTGSVYNEAIMQNLLYEDGWMYFDSSPDFLLEVLYPDYTQVSYYPDGTSYTYEYSSGSCNISYDPFSHIGAKDLPDFGQQTKEFSSESDLSTDSFTFGRAKGSLYFVNRKYVKDVRKSEDDARVLVLDTSQKYVSLIFFGKYSNLYVAPWEEGNLEY